MKNIIVHKYDENGFYLEDIHLKEGESIPENSTSEPMPQPIYKPRFIDGRWVDVITEEEREAMKPVYVPSDIEILQKENALLKAQNQALTERSDFHEEILTEIILTIAP